MVISVHIPRIIDFTLGIRSRPKTYHEKLCYMSAEASQRMMLLCNNEDADCELADIFHSIAAYVQLEKGYGVKIAEVLEVLSSKEKTDAMINDVKIKTDADWSFMAYLEMLREQNPQLLQAMIASLEKQKDHKIPDLRF